MPIMASSQPCILNFNLNLSAAPRKKSVTNALMAKAILALSSGNLRHLGQLSAFCQLIMQISTTNATRKCRKQFTERDEQHLSMRIGSVYKEQHRRSLNISSAAKPQEHTVGKYQAFYLFDKFSNK